MCGIIGCVGSNDVSDVLIDGLSRLEYRGYDSAGIVVLGSEKKLVMRKQLGRINNLKSLLEDKPAKGHIGIGHTRWATHGEPSDFNAHPHCDCGFQIALVHNGIIENYEKLKIDLMEQGHIFMSDTDSEVIAHLLEDIMGKENLDIIPALRKAMPKLRGTFALGLIHSQLTDTLIAVRHDSPLIIGIGQNENFIASDVPAILKKTNKIIYLEDNQIAVLKKDSCEIFDENGKEVSYEIDEIHWKIEESEKGGYANFMLKEIHEQPNVIRKLLKTVVKDNHEISFPHIKSQKDFINNINRIYIVACGTAYYAGLTGRYILEELTGIPVEIDYASEFRYRKLKIEDNSWVIAVSQSGETADTLASIRKAKDLGAITLAIVNVIGSTLTREVDDIIYTQAGPEIGVASTKVYTAQVVMFHMLGLYLGRIQEQISFELYMEHLNKLMEIHSSIKEALALEDSIRSLVKDFVHAKSAFYLGRGYNYPSAMEGALKNKEISYMHAEGYPAGEMKHGPIALIDEEFLVICVCTSGYTYEKVVSNMKEIFARKGRIIAITDSVTPDLEKISEVILQVPCVTESLSPLVNVVPLQLFAYYLALERGTDIDRPRNLAKSVTVE